MRVLTQLYIRKDCIFHNLSLRYNNFNFATFNRNNFNHFNWAEYHETKNGWSLMPPVATIRRKSSWLIGSVVSWLRSYKNHDHFPHYLLNQQNVLRFRCSQCQNWAKFSESIDIIIVNYFIGLIYHMYYIIWRIHLRIQKGGVRGL